MAAIYGKLHNADGLDTYMRTTLRPLDIVLIRSRPALTRLAIPSHFTHMAVWLGNKDELTRMGAFRVGDINARKETILSGNQFYESAGDSVRLAPLSNITNTDEIIIVRPSKLSDRRAVMKISQLFEHLDKPFDFNFDFEDKTRLTCMEVVADVFPEYRLPVRYTSGRYALVPDDLVWKAVARDHGLKLVAHIVPNGRRGFKTAALGQVSEKLRKPASPPQHVAIY
ncbi:MAG: YiiX/YebB-like N1pC/P60 family cysteine hydrolase [Pseudomonadota bacterium]